MATEQYIFGRGYLSATRLNLQHFLWKETLNYDIHPSVPTDPNPTKIADVGTGTGIWLLDLAKRLPSTVQLDGFDISAKQYPAGLPENVSLQLANALEEPPSWLVETYDIVHIRLFMGVINDNDPLPLLNHCMKLLKPGGYLQWDEYDLSGQKIVSSQASLPAENLSKMSQRMQTRWPTSWVARLPETFKEQGLEAAAIDSQRPSQWYAKMSTELDCILREEFASTVLDQKGPPGSGDELRQQIQATYREVEQGSCISNLLQVVVGRKPLRASM